MLIPKLSLIKKVEYIKVSDVATLEINVPNVATLTGDLTEIKVVKTPSTNWAYNTRESGNGRVHTVNGSLQLAEDFDPDGNYLLKVTLDTDQAFLLGNLYEELNLALDNSRDTNQLNFEFISRQKPPIMA